MDLAEPKERGGSKKVDGDKNVRVLAVKGKKVTTTASAKPTVEKLLTVSTKVVLFFFLPV